MLYTIDKEWLHLTIDIQNNNTSVECFLNKFYLSKKYKHLLFQEKEIKRNGEDITRLATLKEGDILSLCVFKHERENIRIDDNAIDVVFEDPFLLIVNKPANLLIHDDGQQTLTLSNRIQNYYLKQHIHASVRPIHRLDRDTTGLIIFCKCSFIQSFLDHELSEKRISREYKAIVKGNIPLNKRIHIEKNIGRDRHSNKQRISSTGKYAYTTITCEQAFTNMSLVNCQLKTGRTHQIRVHLSSIFHPIIGDELYGTPSKDINRLALHAYKISMLHPITKEALNIEIPLPKDMIEVLKDV